MKDTKYFPILPGASIDVAQELREIRNMIYRITDRVGVVEGSDKLNDADLDFIRKNLQVGGKAPINVQYLLGGNKTATSTNPITSVGLTMPEEFSVSGSPISNGSGNILVAKSDEAGNTVYAGPDAITGQPAFRTLVTGDIPNLPESKITNLTTDLAGKVPTSRTISTTSPLTGGGDLTANRTLGFTWPGWTNYTPTITGTGGMTVSGVTVTGAHYIQLGTVVLFEFRVSFTLGGTQAIEVDATLPVNTAGSFSNTVNFITNLAGGGYNPGIASAGSNKVAMYVGGQVPWDLGAWEVIAQGFYQA